jgi:hypothetical protein
MPATETLASRSGRGVVAYPRRHVLVVGDAEELFGHNEYDGSGLPIAYNDLEPFATLDRALEAGGIQIWCLGLTLDALTHCGDILTAAVIAPDIYD